MGVSARNRNESDKEKENEACPNRNMWWRETTRGGDRARPEGGAHSQRSIPIRAKRAGEETGGTKRRAGMEGGVNGEAVEMAGAGSPCCTPCRRRKDGGTQTGGCANGGRERGGQRTGQRRGGSKGDRERGAGGGIFSRV